MTDDDIEIVRADYEDNMRIVCARWPELTPYRRTPVNYFLAKFGALLVQEFNKRDATEAELAYLQSKDIQ